MADGTLTGSTIAATYKSLLKVKGGANTILDGDIQIIEDGDGVDSVLGLSTDSALISGVGNKLYFYDADGGEHISADASGVPVALEVAPVISFAPEKATYAPVVLLVPKSEYLSC